MGLNAYSDTRNASKKQGEIIKLKKRIKKMRPKRIIIDVADENLTGFASNVTGDTWTLTTTETSDGLAHKVSIKNDSGTDHSGKTAILTGTDADNKAQTETITLPAATATVESTKYFKTLITVVPSATIGVDTMDIGWVDEVSSQSIPLNWRGKQYALRVDVTGTLSYTVQNTFDDLTLSNYTTDQSSLNWLDHDGSEFVNATASANSNYAKVPTGSRIILNSYSSGAELIYTLIEGDS